MKVYGASHMLLDNVNIVYYDMTSNDIFLNYST